MKKPLKNTSSDATTSVRNQSTTFSVGSYCRVSTEEQAAVIEGSMDNQRHRMQSFVDMKNHQEKGWGAITEFYIDDGYSAKDTNRPAYQRMLKDLKRGKINAIMVTEISRLSRSIPDFSGFLKALGDQDGEFFSIKEQFDTSTPVGKMMLYNMINLAQFEREQTSERVAINCHSRAMRGLLNGGPVILGYDKHPDKKTTFVVNEAEAEQVRTIFNLYLEHRTLSRTITAIEAKDIKPKARPSKRNRLVKEGRWTTDSLSFVLQNPAYVAKKEVNKRSKGKDQSRIKPWQRYEVVPASWPAIVSEETFNNVQDVLEENKTKERNRLEGADRRIFIATRLLKCAECGGTLVGSSAHGAKKVHRYYIHSQKKGDVIKCAYKRHSADEIEAAISEHLCEMLLQAGHFEKISETIRQSFTVKPEELKRQKAQLGEELKKVSLGIERTFKIQAEMDADSEGIRLVAQQLQDFGRKKKILTEQLEQLKASENQTEDTDDAIDDLKERLEAFKRGWKKATPMAKKSLLKDLLWGVVVSPKGLSIEFRLKHGLNSTGFLDATSTSHKTNAAVIDLAAHRRNTPSPADAGSGNHNLDVQKLQVVGNGRRYRTRTDDIHLCKGGALPIELISYHFQYIIQFS